MVQHGYDATCTPDGIRPVDRHPRARADAARPACDAEWSATGLDRCNRRVGHLEQGPRPRFTPYDRFAQFHESQGKSLHDLLDEFARLRAENLVTLAGWQLTDAHLALEGEHPEFGSVTLRQLLATWVAHDLNHIAQIVRVMAKQYGEAVGPWRAYLSIMNP